MAVPLALVVKRDRSVPPLLGVLPTRCRHVEYA